MKYRKRSPEEFDAIQWNGFNKQIVIPEIIHFDPYDEGIDNWSENLCPKCGISSVEHGWIHLQDCGRIVCPGDWIITEADGTKSLCNSNEFVKKYEEIDPWEGVR